MLSKIIDIVKECGNIVKNARIHEIKLKNEDRRNLVTEYDVRVQETLRQKLKDVLPEASFFGEEGSCQYKKGGYCFVCDPIDGTTNFVKGYNFSAISVALLQDGFPILGVIYNPFSNELFAAEKGKGATLNGLPIHTTQENLADSLVIFGTGVFDLKDLDEVFKYAQKCFDVSIDIRRSGSSAMDLCYVASGRAGYFCEFRLMPWDYSAGVLIVQEAGGLVKSHNFEDISDFFSPRSIFAIGNSKILKEIPKL